MGSIAQECKMSRLPLDVRRSKTALLNKLPGIQNLTWTSLMDDGDGDDDDDDDDDDYYYYYYLPCEWE